MELHQDYSGDTEIKTANIVKNNVEMFNFILTKILKFQITVRPKVFIRTQ
jgi:hypothetical protein